MGYEIVSHSYSFQNSSSLPKGSNNNDIDAVARVPGTWDIRAWIQYPNNITVYSNVVTLTVNFRPISELSAHYNIQTEMDNLWQATKDAASSSGMNEKGFFIYVNTQNVNSYHSLVSNSYCEKWSNSSLLRNGINYSWYNERSLPTEFYGWWHMLLLFFIPIPH